MVLWLKTKNTTVEVSRKFEGIYKKQRLKKAMVNLLLITFKSETFYSNNETDQEIWSFL